MHPYTAQQLAEDHHHELLRSAEAWRLAHSVASDATTRTRSWMLLLAWLRTPVRAVRSLVGVHRSPREPKSALAPCSCPPPH